MLKKIYSDTQPVCTVVFTLPNEAVRGGNDVRVLGEFNEWSWEHGIPMKPGSSGFTTEVALAAGAEYQFRYLIDNHLWENDWAADHYLPTPFGVDNSVISLREVRAQPVPMAPAAVALPGASDDLTVIEGIGPKISELLKAAGIPTFAQLAMASVSHLKAVLDAAGARFQMHDPGTWPEQAALAASGATAELKALQDSLKGGKR